QGLDQRKDWPTVQEPTPAPPYLRALRLLDDAPAVDSVAVGEPLAWSEIPSVEWDEEVCAVVALHAASVQPTEARVPALVDALAAHAAKLRAHILLPKASIAAP